MHTRFAAARGFCALAVPLVMLGLSAGAGPAAAAAPACQGWTGVPPLNPGTSANVLNDVAVLSACNVWAVGSDAATAFGPTQTLIEHWNGSAWTVVPSPDPGSFFNILTGVQAASPADIWAVGSYEKNGTEDTNTLALHWNGTVWKHVATPNPPVLGADVSFHDLNAVRVLSANDAWAVGVSAGGIDQTLILHWNGTRWKHVTSPNPPGEPAAQLEAVAATSARNAWAVGFSFPRPLRTLILHWNGTQWALVASPSPGAGSALTGVGAASPASAWAVGYYDRGHTKQTLIVHWNGHRWTRVASPDPGGPAHDNTLTAVTVTADSAWAVGSYTTATMTKTLILYWNGTAWTQVTSPDPGTANQLNAVRALSAGTAWAVGSFSTGTTPSQTLAVHCC